MNAIDYASAYPPPEPTFTGTRRERMDDGADVCMRMAMSVKTYEERLVRIGQASVYSAEAAIAAIECAEVPNA